MTFTPSVEQDNALKAISAWLSARDKPYFVLQGHAGTGKTTLAGHLVQTLDRPIYGMSFTGKACAVLTSKGIPARTVHSSIYLPMSERSEEADRTDSELAALAADDPKRRRLLKQLEDLRSPKFALRPRSPFDPRGLIIADELSMLSTDIMTDLLSFGVPVLALGDDSQLPSIDGRGFFEGKCDFRLEQVHRQALESPVLRLALMAREGRTLPFGAYGSSRVIRRRAITPADALGVEQILTGSNKARIQLNTEVRQLRGFSASPWPLAGECVICLRNNARDGLLNGMIFMLRADTREGVGPRGGRFLTLPLDNGADAKVHPECFTSPEVLKSWNWQKRAWANEFDFASAITIHRSQGSQFRDTLVLPDYGFWQPDLYRRLLYTGISRAEESVTIAMGKS